MVSKVHLMGTGAILMIAFVAVVIILVGWIYLGYHYEVIVPAPITFEEIATSLAV